ncbi:hypothetical protein KS4_27770 [Poriferisphaera corsica]|uniref:Uncharacterized protein n=1 Tax=Poriferisphaera corsica TaxID=2528020 RepID=A0A517YWT8_9BACT|nr:hypothetical protein [Poriferisphaera corsica]QDU34703.1 hypothetical protein KS4_27770 [Poriferisphaera corsica]
MLVLWRAYGVLESRQVGRIKFEVMEPMTSRLLNHKLLFLLMLCCAFLSTGCQMEYRVVRDGWEEWRKSVGAESVAQIAGQSDFGAMVDEDAQWGIMLEAFNGPDRAQRAQELILKLRKQFDLKNFWLKRAYGSLMVLHGSFEDRSTDEAKDTLVMIRKLKVGRLQPYRMAMMQSLAGASLVSDNPLDAKSYVGFYTLRVGHYNDDMDGDRREMAEEAARVLRTDGHNAFFYHGPVNSLVTVGLFTDDDLVPVEQASGFMVEGYGPRIREIQQEFPIHMTNGRETIVKEAGQTKGKMPCSLVRIF